MYLLRHIDNTLNKVTMYLLLVIALSILAIMGIFLSLIGVLSLSTTGMLASLSILMTVGFTTNQVLMRLYKAPANTYSSLITALILFCILPPVTNWERAGAATAAVIIALASKYILALHNKHIFNPAAFGVLAIDLLGIGVATWWVGSADMLPFTLVLGLLVVRKLRRFKLFAGFMIAALIIMLTLGFKDGGSTSMVLRDAFYSWPLIFFGTIMLTEPATMPSTNRLRLMFAIIVGVLFASRFEVGSIHSSPEVALLAGNLFAYAVSPKRRTILTLKKKTKLGSNLYDFAFIPNRRMDFQAGQYMEWVLPHKRPDSRGNSRTFTIASSPTENEVHLGVKIYSPSSSFKQALEAMKPGDKLIAGQLAGDFTLPADTSQKLVFIAGGIGITPFRSMLQYIADTKENRDITLFYSISSPDQIAYQDILAKAALIVPILSSQQTPKSWNGETGLITKEMMVKHAPNYQESLFYISGPNAMVNSYRKLLANLGVPRHRIKTDHFSGY